MIRQARHVAGLGPIAATVSEGAVVRIELDDLEERNDDASDLPLVLPDPEEKYLLERLFLQLEEYAQGKPRGFSVPWRLKGVTPFTVQVLEACADIPWGKTLTYGELAHRIENPGAVRAVGGALGRNPLPILIPCHRVLSGIGLGGFSAGQAWKRRLLEAEGWEEMRALPHLRSSALRTPAPHGIAANRRPSTR